ncbi:MAG: adenylate/guanylate cyclase domain-containing protein [Alphaproteobacteria bacterium]
MAHSKFQTPTPAQTAFDPEPVKNWLIGAGYVAKSAPLFIEDLAKKLRQAGLPVDRLTTHLPVLHPHVAGQAVMWRFGEASVVQMIADGPQTRKRVGDSPLHTAYADGAITRCRIFETSEPGPFPIIDDLRAQGFTDYVCFAVRFSDKSYRALTVSTKVTGGFDDAGLARFEALLVYIAPILEIRGQKNETLSLLETYIGPTAGKKVLEGSIRSGQGEVIRSVIWFSDMRDSTGAAARLPGDQMIALLNDYFAVVTEAVTDHGGEILKFVGDSVLAIFPCDAETPSECEAAQRAELAAWDAAATIADLNKTSAVHRQTAIDFGIALHIGEVFFGNVGGKNRLDFTVIGSAVNLASRIEGLTRDVDGQVLASQDFANISASTYRQVGAFQFKGVPGWSNVWAPTDPVAPADPVV